MISVITLQLREYSFGAIFFDKNRSIPQYFVVKVNSLKILNVIQI